jgi:serine/threonine protein kinase
MLTTGTILEERYYIKELIGQGGMSSVYLAQDYKLDTLWAIKEIYLDTDSGLDLMAEPEILKRLKHPNLPRIVDIIQTSECIYIVEDYIEGTSLERLITPEGCKEQDVIRWAKQLCDILIYLHNQKPYPIIYRDMKPSNIIIDPKGDAWLVDFGIAREFSVEKSNDTIHLGTRGYAAPEQYEAQTDERTDIYSLGVTLYHAVTGNSPKEPPYEILPIREIDPRLSEGLELIIKKCVAKNPKSRYQSARELLNEFNNIHKLNREYRLALLKKRLLIGTCVMACFLIAYGIIVLENHKHAQALAVFNQYYSSGVQAFEEGDFSAAEQHFERAGEINHNRDIYIGLAKTYLKKNETQQAINYLLENAKAGHIVSDWEVRYLLGTAYFSQEDYQQAISYLESALQNEENINMDTTTIYRDLAVSYGKVGDYAKAEAILNSLSQEAGQENHITHYIAGEIAMLKHSYDVARDRLTIAVELDPNNVRYLITLARLYVDLNDQTVGFTETCGNFQQALSLLNDAQAIDNHNILALNELGKTYYDYGIFLETSGHAECRDMYQQALVSFSRIVDMGIDNTDMLLNQGILLDKLERSQDADEAYNRALAMEPNHSRANLVYGLFKLKQKDYSTAYHYLNKTVQVNQNEADVSTAQVQINELRAKGWVD